MLDVSVDFLLGNTDEIHANKNYTSSDNLLKKYFDEHPVLNFDDIKIPEENIIKQILKNIVKYTIKDI